MANQLIIHKFGENWFMNFEFKVSRVPSLFTLILALLLIYSCSKDGSTDNNDSETVGQEVEEEQEEEPPLEIPGKVLGLSTTLWKLNSFNGTGANAEYEDDILKTLNKTFDNYTDETYFYAQDSFAYFKCYRGLGGSNNSSNPRVELREMKNGEVYYWDGDSGVHTMEWTVRVDQLPKSTSGSDGVLCFGQIHGPSESQGYNDDGVDVDDTIRLQFRGEPNQETGDVDLKISGYITENQGGSISLPGYKLDTVYDFKIVMENGTIIVYVDEEVVFERALNTSGDTSYFKVGNYLQSVKEATFDASSFGLVGISKLTVTHN